MNLKWKPEYSVGIASIDEEHKRLLMLGEELMYMAEAPEHFDYYDNLLKIFDELREYTLYHFESEEKVLAENGYPDLESHRIEHIFFVKKLGRLEKKDIENLQKEAITDLLRFVADWVTAHILKTDKLYTDFLIEKGVQ